jgi:hypothetical protein
MTGSEPSSPAASRGATALRAAAAPTRGAAALGALALGLLLAGCGGGSSKTGSARSTSATQTGAAAPSRSATIHASNLVVAQSGAVRASMRPASHSPKVQRAWPISFTATRASRAARASVSYEYLFGGQVVARRSHYTFTGHFSDVFKWPASAVGYPLTFRAVIRCAGVTLNLDYPVRVVR